MNKIVRTIYPVLKCALPRSMQMGIRSFVAKRQRNAAEEQGTWPINEGAEIKPKGWTSWPNEKKFALVLTHDVDTSRGQDNCKELSNLEQSLGMKSAWGFVPERYPVSPELREYLRSKGNEVYVHDLDHTGKLFQSRESFLESAEKINQYIQEWGCKGFRSGAMQQPEDPSWFFDLQVEYNMGTFDIDPFEPQPEGARQTIFPFKVPNGDDSRGYTELPYTLPQDFTLFCLLGEQGIDIWKKKLDWIAKNGGMALLVTHPDYMNFNGTNHKSDQYPARNYKDFLEYVQQQYGNQYWNALPEEVANFLR